MGPLTETAYTFYFARDSDKSRTYHEIEAFLLPTDDLEDAFDSFKSLTEVELHEGDKVFVFNNVRRKGKHFQI